jgi:hypothetical protein
MAKNGSSTKTIQVNVRARASQVEYWKDAAELMGYGEGMFSQWVKDTLSDTAHRAMRDNDRRRGHGDGGPPLEVSLPNSR